MTVGTRIEVLSAYFWDIDGGSGRKIGYTYLECDLYGEIPLLPFAQGGEQRHREDRDILLLSDTPMKRLNQLACEV